MSIWNLTRTIEVAGQRLPVISSKPMQRRLPKYRRDRESAAAFARRRITARSLEILASISHYRFLTTSMITALIPGNERVTNDHLQMLFHRQIVNRFSIPRPGNPGEFIYYLDNRKSLDLLAQHEYARAEDLPYTEVRRNREKAYHKLSDIQNPQLAEERSGSAMFIKHELMISRFHLNLELACRKSAGRVELLTWLQGPTLHDQVQVPIAKYSHQTGSWRDTSETEFLPHRPDAFFSLHFHNKREGEQDSHFFYEADRKTTVSRRLNLKLRSYSHFIVKQKKHIEQYGVRRIRAVLVETLDVHHANHLRQEARHPLVSPAPSALFWFTGSSMITTPEAVLERIWMTPADDERGYMLEDD